MAKGFFGDGELPWDMVCIGAVLGIIILIIDSIIEKKGISFRLHLMPVAVGMYLPFGLSTPILVGGLMAYLIQKQNKTGINSDDSMQNGILVSSGLIAGESLMGIVLALVAGFGVSSFSLDL